MNILTKFCFNPLFAPQFLKPQGLFGMLVSKVMRDNNFFVYPGIEQHADFRDNERILEIGYGPGVGIDYFLNKYRVQIDGVDFSKMMFLEASKRNKAHIKNGSLKLYHGDFESFLPERGAYDHVIFANVIYFWADLHGIFKKIHTLLTPDGTLVFYMSNKGLLDKNRVADNPLFIKYTDSYVTGVLAEAQFTDISTHSIVNQNNEFLIVKAKKR
jgi:SAM-dependent methyltransferase